MSEKTSVVVVGGGVAAITVAQTLDKTLDPAKHTVTLVTENDYLRHHPAALRAVVTAEGDLESQICIPYDSLFGKNKQPSRLSSITYGKVTSVEEHADGTGGEIVVDGKQRIKWDYLTIASGSEWNGPLRWPHKAEDVKSYLDEWREKFATAKSVVLVGAGAVGSELAGEIRDFYPQTELSVVNRQNLPLNATYPDVFRKRIADGLETRGIKLVSGDSIDNLSAAILDGTDGVVAGRTIKTKNGVSLSAELIVPTVGRRGVNTSFLGASSSPSAATINKSVTATGYLDVLNTLQLKSNPRVFAAGDVVALPEQHTLIKAGAHGPVVAANILALIQAGDNAPKNLKTYTKAMDGIAITNGRTRGGFYLDFFTFFGRPIMFGDWLTSKIKSQGLLVGMAKGAMNK